MTLRHSSIALAGQLVIMQTFSSKARTSVSASRSRMFVAIQTGSVAVSLNWIFLAVPNKEKIAGLVAGYKTFTKQSSGALDHAVSSASACACRLQRQRVRAITSLLRWLASMKQHCTPLLLVTSPKYCLSARQGQTSCGPTADAGLKLK